MLPERNAYRDHPSTPTARKSVRNIKLTTAMEMNRIYAYQIDQTMTNLEENKTSSRS